MKKANKIEYNSYESRLDEYMDVFAKETDGMTVPEDEMDKISDIFGEVAKIPAEYVMAEYLKRPSSVSMDINMGHKILINITVPLKENEGNTAYFSVSRDNVLSMIDVGTLNGVIDYLIELHTSVNEENEQES